MKGSATRSRLAQSEMSRVSCPSRLIYRHRDRTSATNSSLHNIASGEGSGRHFAQSSELIKVGSKFDTISCNLFHSSSSSFFSTISLTPTLGGSHGYITPCVPGSVNCDSKFLLGQSQHQQHFLLTAITVSPASATSFER